MTLTSGSKLGPYEIQSSLGAGGMGEVYRARDTRLDRVVAIKILPAHLSDSPEATKRFDREARAISSLNHPNICTMHDVGHQDGVDYLVMEFLEGETLADRLIKGPLTITQVLKFGIEICEGLEAAHKKGVVHRDLKPGNIMLTRSGAKLLDFGLAKGLANAVTVAGLSTSGLTVTAVNGDGARATPLTAEGSLLGTFQYMSPEQVEGKEADARSDIFALGAVLYEMATAKAAFAGRTTASTIAAVLEREPAPISSIRRMSPPLFDHTVNICLAKDPDERWQTAHDVKLQLTAIAQLGSPTGSEIPATTRGSRLQRLIWPVTALLFGAAGVIAGWMWHVSPAAPTFRAKLLPPTGHSFDPLEPEQFAVSPDGTRMAFVTSEWNSGLWVRQLESGEDRQLPGTDGGAFPFWSPDSKSIGFFADDAVKRVDAAGGPVVTLAEAKGPRGAAWGSNGTIVYSSDFGKAGLRAVPAGGGTVSLVTHVDAAAGEDSHRWPFFLPDGRHLVFFKSTLHSAFGTTTEDNLVGGYLLDLTTGKQKFIVHADSGAQYANGYLLYLQRQNLIAQRFDASRQQLLGSPQPLAEHVAYNGNFWSGAVSVSGNLLAYMSEIPGVNRLIWFDRNGKEDESIDINGTPYIVSLSPDGTRVATQIGEANGRSEIRTFNLARGGETQIAPGVAAGDPIWTPDGKQITYLAVATHQIANQSSSGIGEPMGVVSITGRIAPTSWSPDGKRLLYMNFNPGNGPRTYVHEDGREDYPLLKRDVVNGEAEFSPDGKWVAFASLQTGRYEIYVVPFPNVSTQYQVSLQGGAQPRWGRDGKQLYFIARDRQMMTVEVSANGEMLKLGTPKPLFQTRIVRVFEGYTQYDVSPDGKRFLINTLPDQQQPITIFANWAGKLK